MIILSFEETTPLSCNYLPNGSDEVAKRKERLIREEIYATVEGSEM
jgi:hypothetical protein